MTVRKFILIVCMLQMPVLFIMGQTRTIDALKKNIRLAPDEYKIKTIFLLCEQGYTVHPDTLMLYAENARRIAIAQNNLHDEVQAMYYQSGALTTKGLIDSSLEVASRCLAILSGKVNDPLLQANLFNQKGRCFMRKSKYKEAIDMGYRIINSAEKNNDVLLQVKGKTLIGWAYLEMGQTKESLSWHLKALQTTSDTLLLEKYGILFANLALNYNGLGKTDSAFYFINKAINYSRKHENLFALSNSLAIRAQLLVRSGQAKFAEAPLKEVVEIRKLIGDPFYIVSDMAQLGLYYANNGQPEKGIAICNEGIAIAMQYKIDTKLLFLYSSLAENYKVMGNTARYAEVLENIIKLKDSVYLKNSAQSVAEMQTKYETEKNANIIVQQKLALVKKNYLLFGSMGLLVLVLLIARLLFNAYRRKQKLKNKLLLEEEKYLGARAVTKAEEHERKRIAADLHDNIGAYASAIRADVEKITDNGLEKNTASLQNLQQHSLEIINSLRDTIWVLNKETITITGISDRIKNYLNKLQPSYHHIQFHITEEIENDVRISSQNALNLFRIMQEAIHNALKHSNAANIIINLSSKENILIKIEDDGKGIGDTQNFTGGNGLLNMKERAAEAGFQLNIFSEPDKGTTVFLQPATTN
ncbi:MAG: sensor histidine kinase [Ferruginibacter sp.]